MTDLYLYNKLNSLPAELKKEAVDFIESLLDKSKKRKSERPVGLAKGMIKISDDFDEPLDDLRDYMQ